jgi:hypothetical protein
MSIPGPRGRLGGWAIQGVLHMKLRNLFLALVAVAVLVGSVVPAQAAGHRHHKKHHHHK